MLYSFLQQSNFSGAENLANCLEDMVENILPGEDREFDLSNPYPSCLGERSFLIRCVKTLCLTCSKYSSADRIMLLNVQPLVASNRLGALDKYISFSICMNPRLVPRASVLTCLCIFLSRHQHFAVIIQPGNSRVRVHLLIQIQTWKSSAEAIQFPQKIS